MRRLFHNARLILEPGEPSGKGCLVEQDGIIECLELHDASKPSGGHFFGREMLGYDEVIDCQGDFLSPGLIDLHCHGALQRDAMEASAGAFRTILDYHATRGTTLAVLSTVSASLEEMLRVLAAAEDYGEETAQRLAGIHLEGPYFFPDRRGAHRLEMLRQPTTRETEMLLRHAPVISRMTVAPELSGVMELIPVLASHGIAVSAGHSEATHDEALAGFAAGITQVTHLYNCMSSLRSTAGKRTTGLAEAALTTSGILCEVIADGVHLPPPLLRLAWLCKGWREMVIVSDATAGAGLSEGNSFELGGLPCVIERECAWTGTGEDRRLAGSTTGMIDGVRMMVENAGIPLEEAVAMASLVPALALGMGTVRGSLKPGKRSDLLRFSTDWRVHGVWSAGARIA